MAFNFLRKLKKQDTQDTKDNADSQALPPEPSLQGGESAEDARLLESQIEAIERRNEEFGREQGESPEKFSEGKEVFEKEQQSNELPPPLITSGMPPEELPLSSSEERGSFPEAESETAYPTRESGYSLPREYPETGTAGEAPSLPEEVAEAPKKGSAIAREGEVQREADTLSREYEKSGGGSSRVVRLALVAVFVILIAGGGAFAYFRFAGGFPSFAFLKSVPFVGTYFGGEEPVTPSAPVFPSISEPTSTVPFPTSATPAPPSTLTPEKERDNQRIQDTDNISTQLAAYYAANGTYPVTNGTVEKIVAGAGEDLAIVKALVPAYFVVLPTDPRAGFYYGYSSDGSSYELTSVLEDNTRPDCVLVGIYCVRKIKDGEVVSKK